MEELLEINNLAGLFQCIVKDCKVSEMHFCEKILALELNSLILLLTRSTRYIPSDAEI